MDKKESISILFLFLFTSSTLFPAKLFKIAFAGASSSGKTTLVNFFSSLKYPTIHEVATPIIEEDLQAGLEHPGIRMPLGFQIRMIYRQILLEERMKIVFEYLKKAGEISENKIVFTDRAILNIPAYCNYRSLKYNRPNLPIKFMQKIKAYDEENRCSLVFFLDIIPSHLYEQDDVRIEPWEDVQGTHAELRRTYEKAGYELIFVPRFQRDSENNAILQRINFVCNTIREKLGIEIQI